MRWSPMAPALVLALVVFGAAAIAAPRAECLDPYAAAQRARQRGDLVEARRELQRCARKECPEIVRADCVQWLDEVEQALPTVVFRVRSADGADVTEASLWLDGVLVQERIDGRALALDPGQHRVRVVSGDRELERVVVAAQGEKNRMIVLELPSPAAQRPLPTAALADQAERDGPPPTAAWVLAGVSVIGLASFGYFALTGTRDLERLRDRCAPTCGQDELDAAKRKLVIADLSLAVAVISAGAAAWLFISPSSDGASVAVGARF
jgi:hypothetical protein